ncbi:hypothetical protein FHR87_002886 [Azomonas macrocytogenes]|uniref:Uncharacterized protein n=1 Tax=Azomonas macrocytogenes TaxID=69962 RepID=A0A839T7N0_AZOMA|nr:hypothetical protein [Azomonas macrocytogenes]
MIVEITKTLIDTKLESIFSELKPSTIDLAFNGID